MKVKLPAARKHCSFEFMLHTFNTHERSSIVSERLSVEPTVHLLRTIVGSENPGALVVFIQCRVNPQASLSFSVMNVSLNITHTHFSVLLHSTDLN